MKNLPEKIYLQEPTKVRTQKMYDNDIEYIHKDAFIEKACQWIKSNITNNPNTDSILVRNGCITLGMLIEDFKKYMEG